MPLVRIPPSFAVPQLQLRGSRRAIRSRLTSALLLLAKERGRRRSFSASEKSENGTRAVADCEGIVVLKVASYIGDGSD